MARRVTVDDDLVVAPTAKQAPGPDDLEVPPRAPDARDARVIGREALLVAGFTLVAIYLAYPSLSHFGTRVPGDGGDGLLNLWILRSVEVGLPHGWRALWDARIFYPNHDTLAYSDSLIPIALLHWPLRTLFGDVVALNLIYVASWVFCSWFTYRLALRYVRSLGAAVVAALAYTYAPIRLVHQEHLQLIVGGALLPLTILALLRCHDAPSWQRGVGFGIAFSALTLTASYYGAMTSIFIVVIVVGWAVMNGWSDVRRLVMPLAIALGIAMCVVGPVAIHYLELERQANFRRSFEPAFAAHLGDFLRAGRGNRILTRVPVIGSRSQSPHAGIENRLFPGILATGFGVVGAVVVVRRLRSGNRETTGRERELLLLCVAGAVALVLAFGDWISIAGHHVPLPFALLRHVVPGFSGIRATSRLVLGAELALVLLAAVGVDALLRSHALRAPYARALVVGALAVFVAAESATHPVFVRVPTATDDGGVDRVLASQPPGAVVELPITSQHSGLVWAYVETPRQLLALRDGHRRVNGYSGYQPAGYDALTATLGSFPSRDFRDAARALGVRYVVLRTRLVGTDLSLSTRKLADADEVAKFTDAEAKALIDVLPPGLAKTITAVKGGYVIELASS